MKSFNIKLILACTMLCLATVLFFISCKKDTAPGTTPYDINNSLTLFKLDNASNQGSIAATDTLASMSGIQGKYIPVSGNTGAQNGLGKIVVQLMTKSDSVLSSQQITNFFRPEYHVFNTQLDIPKAARGQVYKIAVTTYDLAGAVVAKKHFLV